eukprot:scaffold19744_cov90-Isochrysis_galbana.AAC.1
MYDAKAATEGERGGSLDIAAGDGAGTVWEWGVGKCLAFRAMPAQTWAARKHIIGYNGLHGVQGPNQAQACK